jgi:hypothetical protein
MIEFVLGYLVAATVWPIIFKAGKWESEKIDEE